MSFYKLIIFDCDGVVVDSEPLAAEVICEMVGELGIHMEVDEALERFNGRKVGTWVEELESSLGRSIADSFIPEFRRRSAEQFRLKLTPVSGIKELLENLSMPYCMASSGPVSKIQLTLTITNLLNFFEGRIFSGYEVGSWKPAPDLFLHAAGAYKTKPQDCLVIEDSQAGVQAGLAAGMTVYHYQPGLPTQTTTDSRVVRFGSMYELPKLLDLQTGAEA